jgi:hypothetical protein
MRVWQALALASAMLTGGAATAAPARCFFTPVSVSEELEKSDAVFAGKAIAEEYRPVKTSTAPDEVLTVRFAVEKWWKGARSEEVTLYTSTIRHSERLYSFMAEDFRFSVGERYLVYASGAPDNLRTNGCRRTKKLESADEDLQKLGEGSAPQQSAQQPSRPTDPSDPMPPPNMDYFVGSWTFEWNVPESPLGPAGKIKGKETYKKTSDGVYESEVEGEGPQGAFKGRATTNYNEKEKSVTRSETGLFGVSLVKTGPIGGDLGGYYTIFWETQPVKKNGKTIKLKGKTVMLSPANYRLQIQISVDGGPYTNFGNPWFRKTQ